MTVKELKEALVNLPEDIEIFADDWNATKKIRKVKLEENGKKKFAIIRIYANRKEMIEDGTKRWKLITR